MTTPAETTAMATLNGKPYVVQVSAFISPGLPYFSIIGCSDASISDMRERIKTAIIGTGRAWPQCRVTVNLSPCAVRRDDPRSTELAAALAICAAIDGSHDRYKNVISAGEIDENGHIGRIGRIGIMAAHATLSRNTTIITGETDAKALHRLGIPAQGAANLTQALAIHPGRTH